jgi:hypothetical protein
MENRNSATQTDLVRLVEDCKRALILGLGRVFEVLDILADDLAVGDEVALRERERGEVSRGGREVM